jgi:hypothetical protein
MRKLLKQPWFAAVLAISAVVFCALSLREPSRPTRSRIQRPVAVAAPEAAVADDAGSDGAVAPGPEGTSRSIAAILAALEFPATIRDPFAPRGATLVSGEPEGTPLPTLPDEAESVHLTAVWQQGLTRLALLNNRIVRVGDQLGRVMIDEITIDGVWVTHWKGRDFVAFGGAFTLLTPAGGAPASALALHEN